MFNNIGGKIKKLAVLFCILGILVSVIIAFSILPNKEIIEMRISLSLSPIPEDIIYKFIFIIVVGSLTSWISSFFLYGFGQLIENSDIQVNLLKEICNNTSSKTDNNIDYTNTTYNSDNIDDEIPDYF